MPRTTDPDALSLKPASGTVRGERARPDFSGVQGSADTVPASGEASDATASEPTPSSTGSHRYVVKAGDTLSHIAQRHYGRASDWRRIYEANRGTIANPDMIHPGQELELPQADS